VARRRASGRMAQQDHGDAFFAGQIRGAPDKSERIENTTDCN